MISAFGPSPLVRVILPRSFIRGFSACNGICTGRKSGGKPIKRVRRTRLAGEQRLVDVCCTSERDQLLRCCEMKI